MSGHGPLNLLCRPWRPCRPIPFVPDQHERWGALESSAGLVVKAAPIVKRARHP